MSGPSRLPGSLPSTLHSSSLKIGDFFTPSEWARFAVRTHGIFPAWMNGKSVFDPSMGSGALLQALVEEGLERGYKLRELPLKSLYGCEKNRQYRRQAIEIFSRRCGMDMSDNFFPGDFLLCRSRPFDIILGNPPWMNFTALPEDYREELKVYFHTYSLVESRRSLLLGSSRVDIAALIINKAIAEHLVPGGRAVFFAPLSLLLGSGAHEAFRRFHVNGTDFALCSVHDFRAAQVFPNVSTRYGLMAFERNSLTEYPVPWFSLENGEWQKLSARPLTGR
ncbi:MAG: SAM-dependent methyltransferase, partial [Spirochaetales bacterium]